MTEKSKPKTSRKFTETVEILSNTKPISNKELIKKNKKTK